MDKKKLVQDILKDVDKVITEKLNEYNYSQVLNELGYSKSDYERRVGGCMAMFYYHLIYIFTLGERLPGTVPHWKKELIDMATYIIATKLTKDARKTDRVKVIEKEMMEPMTGVHFEDYGPEDIVAALDYERKKLVRASKKPENKKTLKWLQLSIQLIDSVTPHAEELAAEIRPSLEDAYDALKKYTKENDLEGMINYINEL